jgi:protein-tyrosine phosphatase
MIDLHTHVLPGVDDGPADLEGSLTLLRAAAAAGTEAMVATPHLREDYLQGPDTIRPAVDRLQEAADAEGIGVAIIDGAEVAQTMLSLLDDADLRRSCLGGGHYILVESPYAHLPSHFADSLFELQVRGLEPVLAHPERCVGFQKDRTALVALVERGVHTSVTAGSMTGRFGSRVREFTAWLFAEGMVTNVASDSHDTRSRHPGIGRGFEALDETLPGLAEQADWYTRDVPTAILTGRELPERPPTPRPKQRSLSRLRPRARTRR